MNISQTNSKSWALLSRCNWLFSYLAAAAAFFGDCRWGLSLPAGGTWANIRRKMGSNFLKQTAATARLAYEREKLIDGSGPGFLDGIWLIHKSDRLGESGLTVDSQKFSQSSIKFRYYAHWLLDPYVERGFRGSCECPPFPKGQISVQNSRSWLSEMK